MGIGNLGQTSPLHVDGFIDDDEMGSLAGSGAAGEIISWVYNLEGAIVNCDINRRVTSTPMILSSQKPVVGIASGVNKTNAILGALRSKLINALITNETTAAQILKD